MQCWRMRRGYKYPGRWGVEEGAWRGITSGLVLNSKCVRDRERVLMGAGPRKNLL